MKLSLVIEGTPRISQQIHYIKKGLKYKPGTEIENEKALRAGIISQLPFDFKPLTGALLISQMRFIFPPSPALTKEELLRISKSALVEKITKPDFTDCMKSLIKAMLGTVFGSESQICGMTNVYKYYGSDPKIEITIEELSNKETRILI